MVKKIVVLIVVSLLAAGSVGVALAFASPEDIFIADGDAEYAKLLEESFEATGKALTLQMNYELGKAEGKKSEELAKMGEERENIMTDVAQSWVDQGFDPVIFADYAEDKALKLVERYIEDFGVLPDDESAYYIADAELLFYALSDWYKLRHNDPSGHIFRYTVGDDAENERQKMLCELQIKNLDKESLEMLEYIEQIDN